MRVNPINPRRLRTAGPAHHMHGLGDAMDVVSNLDTASSAVGDAADAADSLGLDPSVSSALSNVGSFLSTASDQVYQATGQDTSSDSTLEPITVTGSPVSSTNWLLIGGVAAAAALLLMGKKH